MKSQYSYNIYLNNMATRFNESRAMYCALIHIGDYDGFNG